ncbi:helix-turn-helix domain-containing protein [Ruegeria aquimaris]|uniref:Helix-turn-helix domain-containing protein n=1 Tax=Ruegeria aquimaris TaxID=2984333 RepID=A0ABT3AEC6_9RHOB|nr:helix-turn-helix transcriptional regulator [Ruegeria sp. XHP0148]MCV2887022.1 helix-turn-helix domain-containing protein [Ruegeria sp. XHP0148]
MNTVDTVVGQRIRARRMALGLSQADLGRAIGVRFQQVQKYESGANRVSASRLWAIAEVLEVHVSHFFDGIEAPETGKSAGEQQPVDKLVFLKDRDAVEMVEIYSSLPLQQKRAVLAFVRTMAVNTRVPDESVSG